MSKRKGIKKNLMRISTKGMTYNQWQIYRKDYIGGSDIATAMHMNEYQSYLELFHQKVGVVPSVKKESDMTYSGHVLEDIVVHKYWQYHDNENPDIDSLIYNATNKKRIKHCMRSHSIIYDPRMGFLRCNVDRFITKHFNSRTPLGILEAKSGLKWVWNQYEAGIPVFYVLQVQTYLMVTGLEYAEIAVLLDGRHFTCFPMEASKEIHEKIREVSHSFWELVKEGRVIWESPLPEHERLQRLSEIEPQPDGGRALNEYLKERFRTDYKAGRMQITPEIVDLGKQYLAANELVNNTVTKKDLVGQKLKKIFLNNQIDEIVDMDDKVVISNRQEKGKAPILRVNKKILDL